MKLVSKTRYAILGALLESSRTGYEIKSLMGRSTVYFWRESDSTIYPTLKVLAEEGKVLSEVVYVGKKKKEVFSITETGRMEFQTWLKSPTGTETPRNEFLLKLFFITDRDEMIRLFQERLEKVEQIHEEYQKIQERLETLPESPLQSMRLKSLKYGMAVFGLEIQWLKEGMSERSGECQKN